MSNEKGAGKVINMIKCVGGGRWNDGLCTLINVLLRRKEGEIVSYHKKVRHRVDYFVRCIHI